MKKRSSLLLVLFLFSLVNCAGNIKQSAAPETLISDIWVLTAINSNPVEEKERQRRPALEISPSKMQIFGNDGCNNFNGTLEKLDSRQISFSRIAVTRKACINMILPDLFQQNMLKVSAYTVTERTLKLFDDQRNEILTFQKSD